MILTRTENVIIIDNRKTFIKFSSVSIFLSSVEWFWTSLFSGGEKSIGLLSLESYIYVKLVSSQY
jgi:hypothetical protein